MEESVTEILSDIDVNVTTNDIEACHRVGKRDNKIGTTKTIVHFANRKSAKQALYNKKKLSRIKKKYEFNKNNNSFFISENIS